MLAFALSSCNNDDDGDLVVPAAPISYVSLYHASPDAPPIGIFLDERQVTYAPLRYTNFTSYLNFYSGERQMRVRTAGAANVIMDTTFTYEDGRAYSLFYVNQLQSIEALLVKDSLVIPPSGQAAIRFVHLSPDAPAVDVVQSGENPAALFTNQVYRQATPFKLVESGLQSFTVNTTGSPSTVLSIPDINLLPGGIYSIVVRGFATPPAGNNNTLGAQVILKN